MSQENVEILRRVMALGQDAVRSANRAGRGTTPPPPASAGIDRPRLRRAARLLRIGLVGVLATGAVFIGASLPMLGAVPSLAGQAASAAVSPLPRVHSQGDDLVAAGEHFQAWGFNHGFASRQAVRRFIDRPNAKNRMTVERQMKRVSRLGTNTMRIKLEYGQVMRSPTEARPWAVRALTRILTTAEMNGIYLDITGLFPSRIERSPQWYEELPEKQRWAAQARFWKKVAALGAASPSVLLYELTSEPIVPKHDTSFWYMEQERSFGYPAPQYLVRHLRDRDPVAIARDWLVRMKRAVRSRDPNALVSLGMLPITDPSCALAPVNVADLLDVLALHDYPDRGKTAQAISVARDFAASGKPVIIGETLILHNSAEDQREWLLGIRPYVDGYLGFFDGRHPEAVTDNPTDQVYGHSLAQMIELRPALIGAQAR